VADNVEKYYTCDLYLARMPWSERSKEFDTYALNKNGLNSRWNY
jgi:hypothetical protein